MDTAWLRSKLSSTDSPKRDCCRTDFSLETAGGLLWQLKVESGCSHAVEDLTYGPWISTRIRLMS